MTKKVWIVDTGEYSDYMVRGVFDTEESAHDFRRMFMPSNSGVCEFVLNPELHASKRQPVGGTKTAQLRRLAQVEHGDRKGGLRRGS